MTPSVTSTIVSAVGTATPSARAPCQRRHAVRDDPLVDQRPCRVVEQHIAIAACLAGT